MSANGKAEPQNFAGVVKKECSEEQKKSLTRGRPALRHASWLNMVETEIGVLPGQCVDRHGESGEQLTADIAM